MQNKMDSELSHHSYETYKMKFSDEKKAQRYSTRHLDSNKGKNEMACIKKALLSVEKGSLILDLPCGTGRLTYFIKNLGFKVVGADCSAFMIEQAKQHNESDAIQFETQEILNIQYPDKTFSAVVCNRLFHHYPTSEVRRLALKELARVCNGPIIVSFFNSNSLSAIFTNIKNRIKNVRPIDRISIPFSTFKQDIEASGLRIQNVYYSFYGVSPQTYVKLIAK